MQRVIFLRVCGDWRYLVKFSVHIFPVMDYVITSSIKHHRASSSW